MPKAAKALAIAISIAALSPTAMSLAQNTNRPAGAPDVSKPAGDDTNKPAIAPAPRAINLTQEQRFIIRENVKDMTLPKAPANAPDTIGDPVPQNIELHALPPEAGAKVPQARSHLFFVKDGTNEIVLVDPKDRRIADVIR